jgi:uridylate kinase
MTPGQSNDAVAALLAEALNAQRLIRATDVDGVYDQDPQTVKNARKFDTLSYDKLLEIVQDRDQVAGGYALFDLVAARVIQRSKIPTQFIDGQDPDNIKRAIFGEHVGTIVTDK